MKMMKMISNPEAFQLLADETRRRMIYLLRVKEMTVSQIAEQMGLTPQAIYHHIHKLKEVDMIEVAREERIGHFIETYYRSTAEMFHISHGKRGAEKDYEEQTKAALDGLEKLGMKVECGPGTIKDLIGLAREMEECCAMKDWADRISDLGLDYLTQQAVLEYAQMAAMSEKEMAENEERARKVWKILRSCVEVGPALKKSKPEKKKGKR
ncbi:MAG: metalloregulator ArsR/SmtB family transcription factor [Methanobacteriota archaeon]